MFSYNPVSIYPFYLRKRPLPPEVALLLYPLLNAVISTSQSPITSKATGDMVSSMGNIHRQAGLGRLEQVVEIGRPKW